MLMIEVQGETVQFHCPRCGGLMRKPAGSMLYWHVDNNHPRCDITNVVETALKTQSQAVEPVESSPDLPKPKNRRGK